MFSVSDFGDGSLHFKAETSNIRVGITNFGGAVTFIETKDRSGHWDHVCFGHDDLASYKSDRNRFFGCITGRFANRIAKGRFSLNGKEYQLPVNNGVNCLHGGNEGFDKKVWAAEVTPSQLILRYTSAEGEEGFPGALETTVTYELEESGLRIRYQAVAHGGSKSI